MNKWYQEKLRRTLIDMHIEDWNDHFMADFSPEKYLESLKIARINAPMIYMQSHVGYCYWPTKSGKMHKSFIGREDAMKHLFNLCHQADMSVIAYYSLIYNNWAYQEHPEWRMKTVDGFGSRDSGKRYGLCCPNNQAYRDFTRIQMREFCDYFDFEGIFLDMTFWPMVCTCDQCQARWAREVGGMIPTTIDWKDARWMKFQEKRQEWLGEYALDMTAEIKKHKPNCTVEHQYSTALHNWRYGVNENITRASDYAGGDLYGGIAEQSFACKLYYNLTKDQPFEYMTSRCYPSLSEHTSTKSMDLLTLSVMLTYLHHGACLLIDAIDPSGTHDRRVYEKMGQIFQESELLEPYLKRGEMVYDIGLYFNLNGKMDVECKPVFVGDYVDSKNGMPHLNATLGAARALQENKIPYGVLNNWRLDLLDKVKVLVLSDVPNMSAKEIECVDEFVLRGGKAYISGHSCWPLVEKVFGVSCQGYSDEDVIYFTPTEGIENVMTGEFTGDYPMTLFEKAVLAEGTPRGQMLATLTLPYTIPNPTGIFSEVGNTNPTSSFGPDDQRFRFASIHSNPPGRKTDYPALIHAKYGQGEVIWSCAPFEKADRPQHRSIFARLINRLAGDNLLFHSNGSAPVELVMFDAPDYKQKLIGLINLQESFVTLPVSDFDISIKTEQSPLHVLRLPDEQPIPFKSNPGFITIHVDQLILHQMYLIQY